jgi:hypothetical protein
MLEKLKARLVADWRDASHWWSVRMNALGAILYPLLISVQAMPPEARRVQAINALPLPEEVQAIFPLKYRALAAGLFSLAALLARVWAQKKPNG